MKTKTVALSQLKKGQQGVVTVIDETLLPHDVELVAGELERRLLEIGIIEGVTLKVLHFGLINKDPIAVQIDNGGITIAIRRNEAEIILIDKVE